MSTRPPGSEASSLAGSLVAAPRIDGPPPGLDRSIPASPLGPAPWAFLEKEIAREARRTLVGRRFLRVHGPLGVHIERVASEREGRPDLSLAVLYKDFVLPAADVTLATTLGAPLDASRAIGAAHVVADREDALLFGGDAELGLEGLLRAEGQNELEHGDWSKYGSATRDVVKATELLALAGHGGPFALVVSARDYARIVQQREGQFEPEIAAIGRACEAGVHTSPAVIDGRAVLVSTGDDSIDLAVTEDFTLQVVGEEGGDLRLRVYERLVLRIKRPRAICTIG